MKTTTLGLLAGIITMTGFATSAYAAEGQQREHGAKHKGPQVSEEVRAELKSAFEDGDYGAYADIAEENDFKRVISEEQFDKKVERHSDKVAVKEAVLDGNYSEWRALVGNEKATNVTSANFYLLTDLAEARELEDEEDMAAAKEALKDAGIKKPGKGGKKGGRGNRKNRGRGNFGERNGFDSQSVSDMSTSEKENLLAELIKKIKARLGLI